MGFGANLNAILKSKRITVADLAKLTDISPSTLYAIIRRDSDNVNLSAVQKIATVLHVSTDELMQPPQNERDFFKSFFSDNYINTDDNVIDIHFSTDEFSPEEIAEIIQFSEFIKQRRFAKKPPTAE